MSDGQRAAYEALDDISLTHAAISANEENRALARTILGERQARKDQERSAIDLRMASAAERASAAAERANLEAREARKIAIIAIITAAILSAPMMYAAQSLIRLLRP